VLAIHANAAHRKDLHPKDKVLLNVIQRYLDRSGQSDDADVAVMFLESVYKENRLTFEVFACEQDLDLDPE